MALASLSEEQKHLLRRLVSEKRQGELKEPFRLGRTANAKPCVMEREDLEFEHADLLALMNAGMLTETSSRSYMISQQGYLVVDRNFSDVHPLTLESVQEELLMMLVEASRNVPRAERQSFHTMSGDDKTLLLHRGLTAGQEVHLGDIAILEREGLLAITGRTNVGITFDVTPEGFKYYSYLKGRIGDSGAKLEISVREYLNAHLFQEKYSEAYRKWSAAEELLWGEVAQERLTDIGHLCREALQEFVTGLVEQYRPASIDQHKAHTKNRLRAVLATRQTAVGSTIADIILEFHEIVNALIQRQEHGAIKEGETLVWEDARRVVFMTAFFMFESGKALTL